MSQYSSRVEPRRIRGSSRGTMSVTSTTMVLVLPAGKPIGGPAGTQVPSGPGTWIIGGTKPTPGVVAEATLTLASLQKNQPVATRRSCFAPSRSAGSNSSSRKWGSARPRYWPPRRAKGAGWRKSCS